MMAHYRSAKPWCELILNQHMPVAVMGKHHGISLLFPMEKLFESFVAGWLRRTLSSGLDMKSQARSAFLCVHMDRPIFRLEPDILISSPSGKWVLDTKWKLIDTLDQSTKFGLSQADFYQLFAYGHKYLNGQGKMALIYPRTETFVAPLAPFDFGGGLSLSVLPFDLNEETLIGAGCLGLSWRNNHVAHQPNAGTGMVI
jgi:5-methylcytosine-specific restriction enzyme subunit McrC